MPLDWETMLELEPGRDVRAILQRFPSAAQIDKNVVDARRYTLALAEDLTDAQMIGPYLSTVNPPLWELGHLAWFQEYWCLRRQPDGSVLPSLLDNADGLYDSSHVPHATRWSLPLPDRQKTLGYMAAVLERVREKIGNNYPDGQIEYFAQLVTFHEDMHCEAFLYTRQRLGYPAPALEPIASRSNGGELPGDVHIPAGEYRVGAENDGSFVFDNEKWAHPASLAEFLIAKAPVTEAEFYEFVSEGGYENKALWDEAGWAWKTRSGVFHPMYWQHREGGWQVREFDQWRDLREHAPVVHVNAHEARAFCRWAKRRLPTETEWEVAASYTPEGVKSTFVTGEVPPSDTQANAGFRALHCADVADYQDGDSAFGCRQMAGNVWEWTSDMFLPYEGFIADPYRDYSQPWFGNHQVLRGGSFATQPRLLRTTFRNFYTPDRRDIIAGFRTCALDAG